MCFNISLQLKKARMEQRYNAAYPEDFDFKPIYHTSAFEKPKILLLTSIQPNRFDLMNWGLIPSWVKTEVSAKEISIRTMNARAESISQKPSFSPFVKNNRCIIPVTGFFEWQQVGSKKIPWFISPENEDVFSLAGLWSEWANPRTGELTKTFTIITTEANEMMARIHNTKKRMPAILTIENEKRWIDSNLNTEIIDSILKPIDDKFIKAYTISPLVSQTNKNRNVPEVLDHFDYGIQQGNLF